MFRIVWMFVAIFSISFLTASCSQFGFRHYRAITRPVPVDGLAHYENYSSNVKKIITKAEWLSRKKLKYSFGSAEPKRGGMDCSGVIYYLLKNTNHITAPRSSYGMYMWLAKEGKIHHVTSYHFNSSQFDALKPGDLLFWTNTYRTNRRPPITHVMLYLGKGKNNEPLMFGSTDGIYQGREMWGVSVFDFILPYKTDKDRFVAYGCIPSVTC